MKVAFVPMMKATFWIMPLESDVHAGDESTFWIMPHEIGVHKEDQSHF